MSSQPTTVEVEVPPERLERWLAGFVERHGDIELTASRDRLTMVAADGSRADCVVPFPPLASRDDQPYAGLLEHVQVPRRVGVLLVRRGGHAAGVFVGAKLVSSKVGSRHVQGRSKAGGWSQQRFARRRQNQARQAATAAADVAARLLLPEIRQLDAVVAGGDRQAIDAVLADRRLEPVRGKLGGWFLTVPEPRQTVLAEAAKLARMVRIRVVEPGRDVSTEHD